MSRKKRDSLLFNYVKYHSVMCLLANRGVWVYEVPRQKLIRDARRQFFIKPGISVLLEFFLILFNVLWWDGSGDFEKLCRYGGRCSDTL